MTPHLVSLLAASLPLATLACAGPREPKTAPPQPPKVEENKEPAQVDAPAKEETRQETPREWAFVSCTDESCGPENACPSGSLGIKYSDRAGIECVPLVLQKELEKTENWGHPVLIESPVLGSFDRKLACKSKACAYPGSMLKLGGTRFIPIGTRGDGAMTHHYIGCTPNIAMRPGCPRYPTARLLGVVHPITVPGQNGTLLTFELQGVEPAAGSSTAP